MSQVFTPSIATPAFASPARGSLVRRILELVSLWRRRARTRADLAKLARDRRLLRDIGVEPGAVLMEAQKPFWIA